MRRIMFFLIMNSCVSMAAAAQSDVPVFESCGLIIRDIDVKGRVAGETYTPMKLVSDLNGQKTYVAQSEGVWAQIRHGSGKIIIYTPGPLDQEHLRRENEWIGGRVAADASQQLLRFEERKKQLRKTIKELKEADFPKDYIAEMQADLDAMAFDKSMLNSNNIKAIPSTSETKGFYLLQVLDAPKSGSSGSSASYLPEDYAKALNDAKVHDESSLFEFLTKDSSPLYLGQDSDKSSKVGSIDQDARNVRNTLVVCGAGI